MYICKINPIRATAVVFINMMKIPNLSTLFKINNIFFTFTYFVVSLLTTYAVVSISRGSSCYVSQNLSILIGPFKLSSFLFGPLSVTKKYFTIILTELGLLLLLFTFFSSHYSIFLVILVFITVYM